MYEELTWRTASLRPRCGSHKKGRSRLGRRTILRTADGSAILTGWTATTTDGRRMYEELTRTDFPLFATQLRSCELLN
ncbi:hypothetical protein JTE90_003527 [Oedothorax gibbosus]|uniref:Uncharacterized protein n=1 Tax=Oedothorax gibbosus TaxID=931172 RepID=A0AAV6UNY9_9ARAC|nr:hypothetical protein JTE90_003527 [Oedothorax gibbosus]